MARFLGIDTSNYTTSAAVVEDGIVVANKKRLLGVKDGERGIRQSAALFSHTVNLPEILEEIQAKNIDAVGYSAYPRDVKGSYMPCFLAGASAARAVAASLGIPVYRFSHQAGHIMAATYSAGADLLFKKEFIAYHVSGGTTEILHVGSNGRVEKIGGTLDLNAGQAIDRVGVMLGLSFPCGPALEKLAECGTLTERPIPSVRELACNLSGVENKALNLIKKGVPREDIAKYTLEYVGVTLEKLADNVKEKYPGLPMLFAGGVMSNKALKERLSGRFEAYFATPEFSGDNAAGTALLCKREFENSK